jgi:hypothetical protein
MNAPNCRHHPTTKNAGAATIRPRRKEGDNHGNSMVAARRPA